MEINNMTILILFLAKFAYSKLVHHKKTEMTLYYHDYAGGSNPNVVEIPGPSTGQPLNFTKFGAMFAVDVPITEGAEESSASVGRGQSMYVGSAQDGSHLQVLMSLVFTSGKYKGSTLQLQGSSAILEPVREVAVVGGTGKFRLARGYATFETFHSDPARHYVILRSNMTVLHY